MKGTFSASFVILSELPVWLWLCELLFVISGMIKFGIGGLYWIKLEPGDATWKLLEIWVVDNWPKNIIKTGTAETRNTEGAAVLLFTPKIYGNIIKKYFVLH